MGRMDGATAAGRSTSTPISSINPRADRDRQSGHQRPMARARRFEFARTRRGLGGYRQERHRERRPENLREDKSPRQQAAPIARIPTARPIVRGDKPQKPNVNVRDRPVLLRQHAHVGEMKSSRGRSLDKIIEADVRQNGTWVRSGRRRPRDPRAGRKLRRVDVNPMSAVGTAEASVPAGPRTPDRAGSGTPPYEVKAAHDPRREADAENDSRS